MNPGEQYGQAIDRNKVFGLGAPPPLSLAEAKNILNPKNPEGLGHPTGLGRVGQTGLGDIASLVKKLKACPLSTIPTIHSVRLNLQGPMTLGNVQSLFGAKFDPLSQGASIPGVAAVQNTLLSSGQTQNNVLVLGIGFHIEPEPMCATILCNAFTKPTTGTTDPVSPDEFTGTDVTNSTVTSSLLPAIIMWGTWAQYASWHMVRAYNLRWQVGDNTVLFDDGLRYTAYLPPGAEVGSSGQSEVDTWSLIRRVNDNYETNLASTLSFLPFNRIRMGAFNDGTANDSSGKPTRIYDKVSVTYGGMGLRLLLKGNREWRELNAPYMIERGVPIGLAMFATDNIELALMQKYLDVQHGFGGATPPSMLAETNINAGNGATTMKEQTLDSPPITNFAPATLSQRVLGKGGSVMYTLAIKGFSLPNDWVSFLKDPDVNAYMQNETGLTLA